MFDGTANVYRVLSQNAQESLVHSYYCSAAPNKTIALDRPYPWKSGGLCVSLVTVRRGTVISPFVTLLCRYACNNRTCLVLFHLRFFDTAETTLPIAQTFDIEHRVPFVAVRTKHFAKYLQASDLLNRASPTFFVSHICDVKFLLHSASSKRRLQM